MKNWLLGIFIVGLFIFLISQMVLNHKDKLNDERIWYASQLHYNFITRIDSIKIINSNLYYLYFRSPSLPNDPAYEEVLNLKLKHYGKLKFIFFKNEFLEIAVNEPINMLVGDTIRVNTDEDLIKIYRNRDQYNTIKVTTSLRGRPF